MRIIYFDLDSLRADHLGCYGYHRATSPNIDRLAGQGVRFDNCYITDAPCLPSRTALWSGRCGFHNGVVDHGGTGASPFPEGPKRGWQDVFGTTGWMKSLRRAGYHTASVSSFADRHAAWHWYASYNTMMNSGKGGMDVADDVTPLATDWLQRNARRDNWFLHVNYWDPHTPYRTPAEFGDPFKDEPLAAWLTDELWQRGWGGFGPNSPQEPYDFYVNQDLLQYPRMPLQIDSPAAMKRWVDGYDVGIRYADDHIGQVLNTLADAGVLDETAIVVGADHGENHGELNIWGDHHTADEFTCHVPLVVRWPGLTETPRADRGFHYHYDWAATMIELVGGQVPGNWDGQPFTEAFQAGGEQGRPFLVTSQGAWACQRGVRFDHYLCLRTYHDGYKQIEPVMLWDLTTDPHEQTDLAPSRPDLVDRAMSMLADWHHGMMLTSQTNIDPLMTVLREGGPAHTRGSLPAYLKRLRETGRAHHADRLAARHPQEI